MGQIDEIMCDDIRCEDIHLGSVAVFDDITCDELAYGDLNQECVR